MVSYKLSVELKQHTADVRALANGGNELIFSASRDSTVRSWKKTNDWQAENVYMGHQGFVNSLTFLPPTSENPRGLVASGGADKTINLFDPANPDSPRYTLLGHDGNVCSLSSHPTLPDTLVSGSWDKTARIWRDFQESAVLKGHEQAVWSVAWENDNVLTASADKTIKKWLNDKELATYKGHEDVVRGLSVTSNAFYSCSNDCTIHQWSLSGKMEKTLNGHESFVYAVTVIAGTNMLASVSEDRSLKIWENGGCIQTITHPCTSVWCVTALPNGDVVTGGSDGVVRIFSKDASRQASAEQLKEFQDAVSSSAIPKNQVGDVNKDTLADVKTLDHVIGKKDGEVKMVRNGDTVEAHQWSVTSQNWTKIGDVVDAVAPNSGRKMMFEGKEYDYVFDVDIGEGVPPLKLPYNVSENPWQAAQDFIWKNELPQDYLDQVANFIVSNAKGVSLGTAAGPTGGADPFTGGGRYIPGSASTNQPTSGPHPFLQPSGHTSGTTSSTTSLVPQTTYSLMKAATNGPAMLTKILQFNSELEKSMDYGSEALNKTEIARLEALIKNLEGATAKSFGPLFTEPDLYVLAKMATRWPAQYRFPCLDLLRLTVVYSPLAFKAQDGAMAKDLIENAAGFPKNPDTTPSKADENNMMFVLRFLSNMFGSNDGRELMWQQRSHLLDYIEYACVNSPGNKNLRLAYITLLLNYTVLARQRKDDEFATSLLASILEFLQLETDHDNELRGLIALGTAISISQEVKDAAKALDAMNLIKKVRKVTSSSESSLKQVEEEVAALLK